MPPWAAARMKSLSVVETLVSAVARGTRSPTAIMTMPSVVDADLMFISYYLAIICFIRCGKGYTRRAGSVVWGVYPMKSRLADLKLFSGRCFHLPAALRGAFC